MQLDQDWLQRQGADAPLLHRVNAAFAPKTPDRIGVAVSGGGDSMALLHLFIRLSRQTGQQIAAVTVDHGLRVGSASEAATVAAFCAAAGVPHDTLQWTGWDGRGNLPAMARAARYDLMQDWAGRTGMDGIVLGHTKDDVAETFVMRLARKAGIDGLATMQSGFVREGVRWARPLLGVRRAALRDYLTRHAIDWVEDPTNDDPAYERVRIRSALAVLDGLGVDVEALSSAAHVMSMARGALEHYVWQEARANVTVQDGDLLMPLALPIPHEVIRRLHAKAVQWIGRLEFPPRDRSMREMQHNLLSSGKHTVGGCLITAEGKTLRFAREANAVKDMRSATDAQWDGRWTMVGPHAPDLHIAALGDGILQCPDWRGAGLPRASIMASPAVWRGDRLVAAPLAEPRTGINHVWMAHIVADFHGTLLSH